MNPHILFYIPPSTVLIKDDLWNAHHYAFLMPQDLFHVSHAKLLCIKSIKLAWNMILRLWHHVFPLMLVCTEHPPQKCLLYSLSHSGLNSFKKDWRLFTKCKIQWKDIDVKQKRGFFKKMFNLLSPFGAVYTQWRVKSWWTGLTHSIWAFGPCK